jgi:hypothetical protein
MAAVADSLAQRGDLRASLELIERARLALSDLSPLSELAVDRPTSSSISSTRDLPGDVRYQEARAALARLLRTTLGKPVPNRRAFAKKVGWIGLGTAVIALFAGPVRRWTLDRDLTVGARWTASSTVPGVTATGSFARRGIFDNFPAYAFQTNTEDHPALDIDLGEVRSVETVSVVNRFDCCLERTRGLTVMLSLDGQDYHKVAAQDGFSSFRRWQASFPRCEARYVRLLLPRTDSLALSDVRVFGR